MRRLAISALALAFGLSVSMAVSQDRHGVPVLVGGEESDEGCPGTGAVTLRDMSSYLNLRAGPGTNHAIIGRLAQNQGFSICQMPGDGWMGIVIHPTGASTRDCKLSDAGPKPKPYQGPCQSGWIAQEYVRLVAG